MGTIEADWSAMKDLKTQKMRINPIKQEVSHDRHFKPESGKIIGWLTGE
jgi:hypothetical protein